MGTIPGFLSGESHGQGSLVGYTPQCRTKLNTIKVTQHAHYKFRRTWWFLNFKICYSFPLQLPRNMTLNLVFLLNLLTGSRRLPVASLEFSEYKITLSENKDTSFFLSYLYTFCFFLLSCCPLRTFYIVSKKIGENKHPYLFLNLGGKHSASNHST